MINFYADVMNTAVVRNPDILEILNKQSDLVKRLDLEKVNWTNGANIDRDYYVSHEYCDKIRYMGAGHLGFPEASKGVELSEGRFNYNGDNKLGIEKEALDIGTELHQYLGAYTKALHMVYPPGGFIGWHNNANAPGYNILFTWSETGDGYWEHIDPKTGELVRIPDIAGWQCKYGYYGTYDEPERLCYHAASTNCLRTTVAYVFNADERGKMMAEMVVEEIETA